MTQPDTQARGDEACACPVCDTTGHETSRTVFDDRYGHPASFQLVRCAGCGHVMTSPRLREADLPDLYGTFYPRKALKAKSVLEQAHRARAPWAPLARWWMGTDNEGHFRVRHAERLLDVGCGSGLSLLVARDRGAEVHGIDADPNVSVLAEALGVSIHQGSIHDHPFPGLSFDLVTLNQVIEHVPEPGLALEAIDQRLVAGGRIVLVFPNRDSLWRRLFTARWIHWHIPYHLHHFDLRGFRELARRHGFRVVWHRTITPNLWTLLQVRAARMQPEQGRPNPVWQLSGNADGEAPAAARRSVRHALRSGALLLVLAGIGLLNRCVDLLGQGDCLMVELRREADL
jgi:SAM-dependent methyltransferase